MYGRCFEFQHGMKKFQNVGPYLGVVLNGLSLLWRRQNIVNYEGKKLTNLPQYNRYENL